MSSDGLVSRMAKASAKLSICLARNNPVSIVGGIRRQFIVPTIRLLANHSVTYFRCGSALWRQPWKSHKRTHVDEASTTYGRAVGLPKQHSFCIFSRLWSVAIHWHTQWSCDMAELMLPSGSNSSPQDLAAYVESTLPQNEEMSLDR